MLFRLSQHSLLVAIASSLAFCRFASASPAPHQRRQQDVTPAISTASADTAYLPLQIGAIVGSYAVSLIIVATLLLLLSKRRRERLNNGENEAEFFANVDKPQQPVLEEAPCPPYQTPPLSPRSVPRSPVVLNIQTNFSANVIPASPLAVDSTQYITPSSPDSTRSPLGIDSTVDQRVVSHDRIMAQAQLEDMYKYVMEHDEAKLNGVAPPPIPAAAGDRRGSGGSGPGPARPPMAAQPNSI
ncbi:hypothetical protein IMZ48_19795, partial [Candidatus Bathyarchaeota archaeon]|nr:hypothetical protein [Candidatus Bathyarchaeota archaeon]